MVMHYLCVTTERRHKSLRVMEALSRGMTEHQELNRVLTGEPPVDSNPFVVWGQAWLSERIIPKAVKAYRPFWHIDNGFWNSARGTDKGYYRLTYRSMTPILLRDPPPKAKELGVKMKPWRSDGRHVLIGLPGEWFGRALGIDIPEWRSNIQKRVRQSTNRPIKVRQKTSSTPLERDLANAWAVVTHSSNIAFDAVLAGIPVFVEPTSAAAPIGRTDLDIEHPVMPDREKWLDSLLCQQFTLHDLETDGFEMMKKIARQVDGI